MQKLGAGIIGYGFMGKMHSYSYASLPFIYDPPPARVKLVGVAARTEATRAHALERAGFEFATTDYNELLERNDIQIINICTPNYLHYEQAMAAISAGKHVYCDKPLGVNVEQAYEMAEAARKSGLTCQITFHNRFCPAIMRAKQLADEGFLGDIVSFRAAYLHSGYANPNRPMSWRLRMEQSGGGALYDLGSHIIDMVRYIIGNFSRVNASLRTIIKERPVDSFSDKREKVTVDDIAILKIELPNGAIGTIEASRIATGAQDDLSFEIHGSRGAIKFNLMEPNWLYIYDDTKPVAYLGGERGWKRVESIQNYPKPAAIPGGKAPIGWTRFHIASIYEFVKNVVECKQGNPSFEDGLAVQKIMSAAQLSSKTGRWESII